MIEWRPFNLILFVIFPCPSSTPELRVHPRNLIYSVLPLFHVTFNGPGFKLIQKTRTIPWTPFHWPPRHLCSTLFVANIIRDNIHLVPTYLPAPLFNAHSSGFGIFHGPRVTVKWHSGESLNDGGGGFQQREGIILCRWVKRWEVVARGNRSARECEREKENIRSRTDFHVIVRCQVKEPFVCKFIRLSAVQDLIMAVNLHYVGM